MRLPWELEETGESQLVQKGCLQEVEEELCQKVKQFQLMEVAVVLELLVDWQEQKDVLLREEALVVDWAHLREALVEVLNWQVQMGVQQVEQE